MAASGTHRALVWGCSALLLALALPCQGRAARPEASLPPQGPAAGDSGASPGGEPPAAGQIQETLVVGFTILGSDPWKKKSVGDLDVLVGPAGRRYLPLYRLLKEFELERTIQGSLLKFLPEGMPLATLDLGRDTLEVDRVARPVELIRARSESSGEYDLFLAPDTVAAIFGVELSWNEAGYEFVARSTHRLKIWKSTSRSAHEIQVQDVPANLPEAHPPAPPRRFGLDFLELVGRASLAGDDNLKEKYGRLDNLQQTLWGSFLGGAYKASFSERDIQTDSRERSPAGTSPVMLTRGEWSKRYLNTELSLGDSAFGLSDLAFPGVRVTGVRLNGLAGYSDRESARDRSGRGLRNYFVQPQVFAGSAPRGSQVELKINGRIVETQEAVPAADSEVGSGEYRFEDVILPAGSLNEVLVTVTDPNGIRSYQRQELLGSSLFQAPGRLAYIASAGTGRDVRTWQTRGIFAGGRLLYAFSDRLSAGLTLGAQDRFFDRSAAQYLSFQQRPFPDQSLHAGGQLAWRPGNYLILSAEAAQSLGSSRGPGPGAVSYDGAAFKADLNLFPSSSSSLSGEYFRYGADFFNGQNLELHDRQGYLVRGRWRLGRDWSLTGLNASIADNLDGKQPQTLELDLQNLEITTSALPHATVSFSANRSAPSWEPAGSLYILKLYAMVTPDLTVNGAFAVGDSLSLKNHSDFANGVNISGLATEEPSAVVSLALTANQSHELGATYSRSSYQEKVFGTHRCRVAGNALRLRTDLGYDLATRSSIVKNRTEYLLDRFGDRSLELVTDYQNRNLSLLLSFNYRGLFDFRGSLPAPVQNRYLQPDNGGVTGRVFIDYDASATPDPGEPGLENVKVVMNGASCLTDTNGYFKLPSAGEISEARVFLDMSTVPAIYSPTHALQKAHIVPGIQTEVNLGVTPLIAVTGLVLAETAQHQTKPLYGVRVFATRPGEARVLAESSTAGDGSYYLGDLRPGRYLLQVDREFLQKNLVADNASREIVIAPAREPQELGQPPFSFAFVKQEAAPGGEGRPADGTP